MEIVTSYTIVKDNNTGIIQAIINCNTKDFWYGILNTETIKFEVEDGVFEDLELDLKDSLNNTDYIYQQADSKNKDQLIVFYIPFGRKKELRNETIIHQVKF